jgi:nitrate reductase molybdenum cofactor assembly chaperone
MAKLWCSPAEDDIQGAIIRKDAENLVKRLESVDKESAMTLSRFLEESTISEEDYIDLFELNPRCPLYLGSHTYEEPKTCATAAVSDRNEYMIELAGIYSHFGQKLNGAELPDYLPLMVDFLALTTKSSDDPVRIKLCNEYLLPLLPPMRSRLGDLETPYLHLLDALERVISVELDTQSSSAQVESHVG